MGPTIALNDQCERATFGFQTASHSCSQGLVVRNVCFSHEGFYMIIDISWLFKWDDKNYRTIVTMVCLLVNTLMFGTKRNWYLPRIRCEMIAGRSQFVSTQWGSGIPPSYPLPLILPYTLSISFPALMLFGGSRHDEHRGNIHHNWRCGVRSLASRNPARKISIERLVQSVTDWNVDSICVFHQNLF